MCQGAHHGSPIVEIEMIGIPADCAKHKSKVVTRNTVNPIWNEFYTFKLRLNGVKVPAVSGYVRL